MYPPDALGIVKSTGAVTYTLTSITPTNFSPPSPPTLVVYTWTGVSTPSESRQIGPGVTRLNVPSGTTQVNLVFWGAGGSGGAFILDPTRYGSGSGGAGGSTIFYVADATDLISIVLSVATETTSVGQVGGDTTVTLFYRNRTDTFVASGGNPGTTSTTTSTPGGTGRGFSFIYQSQSVNPPPNFIGVNGTTGGNSSQFVNPGGRTTGGNGQNHPTSGELGGIGGTATDQGLGQPVFNAPGGGGAGYQGRGGSALNFVFEGTSPGQITVFTAGSAGPISGPGGGGAGQAPVDAPGVTTGGAGGALVTFT